MLNSTEWTFSGSARQRAIFAIALVFSVFQIYTATFNPIGTQIVRALHVGFLCLLVMLMFPGRWKYASMLLGVAAMATGFYQWVFEGDLVFRSGDLNTTDMFVGVVALFAVFDSARRLMGWALPSICATFLAYALFGQYLPQPLGHRGYGFDQIIEQMAFGTEGIYGVPTYVSSSYIFLFILFGSFLESAGMIKLFTDFALGTVGHTRGGPAKVSVVSSGLMGTINGSGVANVVTTGQFTIPLMKRFGYSSAFAGGVEATASMGGQLMPPVMGAVAFIMAETLDMAYLDICIAALIPAMLYFITAFWMVHLEAARTGLKGLAKADCPDPWAAVKTHWYLLGPLVMLVALLFSGYTPLFAGTIGLFLTVVLILGTAVALRLPHTVMRVAFWVVLALLCAGFFEIGAGALLGTIALLAFVLAALRDGGALHLSVQALANGARHALPVGVACALVGVIIGVLTLTGAATTFANAIISLGETSLFLSLLLTMLVCLILGMGIPTIPNYIITSSLAAPALLDLGVPLLVSHMFVFYFGILADLTPPVALAAFAAAPIAKESGLKIGVQAVKVAFAGFVVPYMAVYSPALMLQGDPTVVAVVYIVFKALVAIGLWGVAASGYWRTHLTHVERVWALLGAGMLVVALPITDELGLSLAASFVAWHWWRTRTLKTPAV
jgi:TRAP transporter 4TM/12TM fusion protein